MKFNKFRNSIKEAGKFLAVAMMLCSVIVVSGCSVNLISVANDAIVVTQDVVAADPTAPYAADLNLAITAMQIAVSNWNGTSTNCELQSAATTASDILNSVAPGSKLALVAAVAIAGLDTLLADLAPCTTSVSAKLHLSHTYPHTGGIRATTHYTQYFDKFQKTPSFLLVHTITSTFKQAAKQSGLNLNFNIK